MAFVEAYYSVPGPSPFLARLHYFINGDDRVSRYYTGTKPYFLVPKHCRDLIHDTITFRLVSPLFARHMKPNSSTWNQIALEPSGTVTQAQYLHLDSVIIESQKLIFKYRFIGAGR